MSHGTIVMDSYADTAVCGSNFIVLNYNSQECDVTLYNSKDVEKNLPIANYATSWDDYSGSTCIIKIHQSLHMGDSGMNHSVLNPNQLRTHGVQVQDNPFKPVQFHIDTGFDNVIIPLFTQVAVIFTDTRSLIEEGLSTCQHIAITSSKTWDPHNLNFPNHATVIEDNQSVVKASTTNRRA